MALIRTLNVAVKAASIKVAIEFHVNVIAMAKLYKCPFCSTLAPIEMLKGHIRVAHQWWIEQLQIGI